MTMIKDTVHTRGFCICSNYNFILHFPFSVCSIFLFLQNIVVPMSSSGLNIIALFQVCAEMEIVVIMRIPITSEQNTKCTNMKYTNTNTK